MPSTSRRPLARPARSPFAAVLSLAMASGLAFTNAGCGQTACLEWSENERISETQICPASAQALKLFGACTDITAVNDDGAFANNLCCYSVTKAGPSPGELGCGNTSTGDIIAPPPPGNFAVSTIGVSTGFNASTGGLGCDEEFACGDTVTGCIGCALNGPCHGEFDNCTSNSLCVSFLNCLGACPKDDDACADACGTNEPKGLKLYTAMIECSVCMQCPHACFAMAEKSCSGTTSSSTTSSSTSATSTTGGGGGAGGMSGG